MYERSAIVLERYFSSIFGYFSENNLKVNFENYNNLVEKLAAFEQAHNEEQIAIQEFEEATERLKLIQKSQEKLYKKNAKLEFNRNILFNNLDEKAEETERCILKIENDIDKNEEAYKELRTDFISALNDYNEKNKVLAKKRKEKKEAQKLYAEAFKITEENLENINEFTLEFARNFNGKEVRDKLITLMIDNGKEEKIPFDRNVIELAVDLGIDIAEKEAKCYIDIYDSTLKLFEEIEKNDVKIEKFKRRVRNEKVKLNFLFAEKEYVVQFLDYERITSVNGKKIHKRLMLQACENFELDIIQIRNLYELILKEIANKATKKIYKELYNKSYLLDINKEEATFKKEKNKVDLNVGTILGSNYWRIEGIKNIYTVFYKDVSEVFGKNVDEFDVPEEDDDMDSDNELIDEDLKIELIEESATESIVEPIKKKKTTRRKKVEKVEEIIESELPQLIAEEVETEKASIETKKVKVEKVSRRKSKKKEEVIEKVEIAEDSVLFKEEEEKEEATILEIQEETPYEDDDQAYELEEEESLFGNIKKSKEKERDFNIETLESFEKENKTRKRGIFKSLMKMNSKKDNEVAN